MSFNSLKKILPHAYFMLLAAYWFYDSAARQYFNYIPVAVIAILLTQLILKNKMLGATLGILATVFSLLLFLAVLSEFNEFKVASEGTELITVGTILSLTSLCMGIVMASMNIKRSHPQTSNLKPETPNA